MPEIERWDIHTTSGVIVGLRPRSGIQYYRVPHDIERVNWNAGDLRYRGNVPEYRDNPHGGPVRAVVTNAGDPMPEVYRLDPDHHTILDCYWQWIWRDMNVNISDKKWSTLLGNGLALTNNTGFPGHYNCVTGEEKPDVIKPSVFPRFDTPRVMGGAILTGIEMGGLLYITSLLVNDHSTTLDQIVAVPWLWYWWTSVNPEGEVNYITREGADGEMYSVRVPLVTTQQVTLPLSHLHKLPIGSVLPPATSFA